MVVDEVGSGSEVSDAEGQIWATWVKMVFTPPPPHTVDGRNPFRTTSKPWKTIVGWYLQGNHHSRVSWVVRCMDFVHPQYGCNLGVSQDWNPPKPEVVSPLPRLPFGFEIRRRLARVTVLEGSMGLPVRYAPVHSHGT